MWVEYLGVRDKVFYKPSWNEWCVRQMQWKRREQTLKQIWIVQLWSDLLSLDSRFLQILPLCLFSEYYCDKRDMPMLQCVFSFCFFHVSRDINSDVDSFAREGIVQYSGSVMSSQSFLLCFYLGFI